MGISTEAAQGIYAKLVQNQLITANTLCGTLRPATLKAQPATEALRPKSIKIDIEKLLGDAPEEETELTSQEGVEEIEGLNDRDCTET